MLKNINTTLLLFLMLFGLCFACVAVTVDTASWKDFFLHSYDYTLRETEGLERTHEPVEVTLSMSHPAEEGWEKTIRVVRLTSNEEAELIPYQIMHLDKAIYSPSSNDPVPASVESANVLFFASCSPSDTVRYRLYWGLRPDVDRSNLPEAIDVTPLEVTGEAPGLHLANEFYDVSLDPKSGGILTARFRGRDISQTMFYHTIPMHFAVDVWSPPQGWDHDYDWISPPNQNLVKGPLAVRYSRWGQMQKYPDVEISITYTFYAHVPWIHVSATMQFTNNRSARAVRIGEIVVSHTHQATPNEKDADGKSPDVFTHYGWLDEYGDLQTIEVNAHRDEEGRANLPAVQPGALAILRWDTPWVAGWDSARNYGLATLRKNQFMGNTQGKIEPKTVPCTYIANYGWGFTYWSRPVVYPFGARNTPEDINTVVPAGTLYCAEEALLFFQPDDSLTEVRETYLRVAKPLRHVFLGTGPW